jgi:SAM-dependent methyltransferase
MTSLMNDEQPFDAAYYQRFYESRRTRVYGPEEVAKLAHGVTGFIGWFGGDLRSVLDVGAGSGLWRDWFKENLPAVKYRSTDISPYACERYGHELRDIATWRSKEKYDLVICQGVLPYLEEAPCAAALENIAAMTRGFLYLEAVTQRDLEQVCDLEKTDRMLKPRPKAWYLERLKPHYRRLGCGLWYRKSGPIGFYELERA